ncbi:MAG: sulfotransferase [Alloalcanivorax venustensis]|uniref:sulfotransferase n=1 Tax=Alloalcanivorax venustensis TaxID=172371 RepID=UPI00329A246A
MGALLKAYGRLFVRSWCPDYGGTLKGVSPRRWLVMALFWPLFGLLQAINGAGLLLDHLLFPDFRRVRVREPLFVVAVPRSGTTFLHRLLAGDRERFTTTALWELIFAPSITQRFFWRGVGRLDALVGAPLSRVFFRLERWVLGGLDDVHQTGLRDPEEDYLALLPVLGCFLLVLAVPDPALWRLTYADRDLPAAEKQRLMAAYRRFVQRHLYFHGEHRTFLSKNPSFTPFMATLADAFPDARFIGCLRNPTAAVPSQINSIVIGGKLFDGRDTADYWREGFLAMLDYYYRHLLDQLDGLPEGRGALSVMETLAAAPGESVSGFYRAFGWTPSPAYRAFLEGEDRRAAGYRSGHRYSLENLGVDPGRLEETFGWVYDRFGYPRPTG